MGSQAGAAHGRRQAFAEAADDPQHLAFAGQVEAVAGLDLQRRHAVAQQGLQALARAGQQFFLAGLAVARTVLAMPPPAAAISA
ncbi:hypothetical protein [Pseudomonas aeruginosa]|uniref:hypothetical protein n=1 Tax=Pseudomonas aeruginosa TaxID=287 RepID=UPI0021C7C9F5|nr:hypothetical protein [Pseudomonas aeruginosa]